MSTGVLSDNKKVLFSYEVIDRLEAGLILQGWEVKSIKAHRASLKESFIAIKDNRVWLVGCHVAKWPGANLKAGVEIRDKELLLSQGEVQRLKKGVKVKGNTIVPLNLHLASKRVKVEIALARGKKLHDKREVLKAKDQKRQVNRDLKKLSY